MDHSWPILENAEALLEILTAKELEAFLRIDAKTIYSYVQRGLIPHMRIESNLRFSKHPVLRWLEEAQLSALTDDSNLRQAPMRICRVRD